MFDEADRNSVTLVPGWTASWNGVLTGGGMVSSGLYHVVIEAIGSSGERVQGRYEVGILVAEVRAEIQILDAEGRVMIRFQAQASSGEGALTVQPNPFPLGRPGTFVEFRVGGKILLREPGASPISWNGQLAGGNFPASGTYRVLYVETDAKGRSRVLEAQIEIRQDLAFDPAWLTAYPNPLPPGSVLSVNFPLLASGHKGLARLYSLDGTLTRRLEFDPGAGRLDLDREGLSAGVYLLLLRIEGPSLARPSFTILKLALL
jgi:hypothetical protein